MQFIQEKFVCPHCAANITHVTICKEKRCTTYRDCCNVTVGECRPECQNWNGVRGVEETALPAVIGLYYHFDVDKEGIPSGCPGFDNMRARIREDRERWHKQEERSGVFRHHEHRVENHNCSRNSKLKHEGTPLWKIIEEYANDPDSWIADFMGAFEGMLQTGYADDELTLAPPEAMSDIGCQMKDDVMIVCASGPEAVTQNFKSDIPYTFDRNVHWHDRKTFDQAHRALPYPEYPVYDLHRPPAHLHLHLHDDSYIKYTRAAVLHRSLTTRFMDEAAADGQANTREEWRTTSFMRSALSNNTVLKRFLDEAARRGLGSFSDDPNL